MTTTSIRQPAQQSPSVTTLDRIGLVAFLTGLVMALTWIGLTALGWSGFLSTVLQFVTAALALLLLLAGSIRLAVRARSAAVRGLFASMAIVAAGMTDLLAALFVLVLFLGLSGPVGGWESSPLAHRAAVTVATHDDSGDPVWDVAVVATDGVLARVVVQYPSVAHTPEPSPKIEFTNTGALNIDGRRYPVDCASESDYQNLVAQLSALAPANVRETGVNHTVPWCNGLIQVRFKATFPNERSACDEITRIARAQGWTTINDSPCSPMVSPTGIGVGKPWWRQKSGWVTLSQEYPRAVDLQRP